MVASLVAKHRLWGGQVSAVAERGSGSRSSQALGCKLNVCGTRAWLLQDMWDLPAPGSKLHLLHHQVDSLPLRHQGSLAPDPGHF